MRRAKLYYLRDLRGKAAKIREKRDGIEGYGDGITSTPEVALEEVAEKVDTEASETVVETPAVEEVAVAETAAETTSEVADVEEAK